MAAASVALPDSLSHLSPSMGLVLISQGAEARVYEGTFCGRPVIVKERFPKQYRHPTLDDKLTKKRLVAEARCLVRCRKAGIHAPCPLFVDETRSIIFMEKLDGVTARAFLNTPGLSLRHNDAVVAIGTALGRLHNAGMVHGDPTTSNFMISTASGDLTDDGQPLIVSFLDFGLSTVSSSVEDKAVDMYVLERAYLSTHPGLADKFEKLLEAYFGVVAESTEIRGQFNRVRARGRKRTAFG